MPKTRHILIALVWVITLAATGYLCSMNTAVQMNLQYTQQIDTLLGHLSDALDKGRVEEVRAELRAFSDEYHATYESPPFWELMRKHFGIESPE